MLSPTVGKHGLKKESDERRARAARGERSQHAEAAARSHTRHPGEEGQGETTGKKPRAVSPSTAWGDSDAENHSECFSKR